MDQFVVNAPGAVLAVRQSRDDGEPLLLLHGPLVHQIAGSGAMPGGRARAIPERCGAIAG